MKKTKGTRDNNPESYQKIEEEFGDLFFTIINAARLYGIDPENALERTNIKFIERFNYLEKTAHQNGKTLKELSMDEMDTLWEEAKKVLNKPLP